MAEETTEQRQAAALITAINTRDITISQLRTIAGQQQITHANIRDHAGRSPLIVAIETGNSAITRFLLSELRANPNANDAITTPLKAAVRKGNLVTLQSLFTCGANWSEAEAISDYAAREGSSSVVTWLQNHRPVSLSRSRFKPPAEQKEQKMAAPEKEFITPKTPVVD